MRATFGGFNGVLDWSGDWKVWTTHVVVGGKGRLFPPQLLDELSGVHARVGELHEPQAGHQLSA